MTNTLTHVEVTRLPELTPHYLTLTENEDKRAAEYGAAAANAKTAWDIYSDAIDWTPEQVQSLGVAAEKAEADKVKAYYNWQTAKKLLLATRN